jgi:hypothetical protein
LISANRRDIEVSELEDGRLMNSAVVINKNYFIFLQFSFVLLEQCGLILDKVDVLKEGSLGFF